MNKSISGYFIKGRRSCNVISNDSTKIDTLFIRYLTSKCKNVYDTIEIYGDTNDNDEIYFEFRVDTDDDYDTIIHNIKSAIGFDIDEDFCYELVHALENYYEVEFSDDENRQFNNSDYEILFDKYIHINDDFNYYDEEEDN